MASEWEVVVGNIGTVYSGDDEKKAASVYKEYVRKSGEKTGRAAGETVTLMEDGDIIKEESWDEAEEGVDWTARDAGCYGDAAAGHEHVRSVLADLVKPYDEKFADELRGEPPDDLSDEDDEDDAIDLLNEHTAEPAYWSFEAGDLILFGEDEEEE